MTDESVPDGAAALLAEPVSTESYDLLVKALGGMPYTTTLLLALAEHCRVEFEDQAGADLLSRFAREFAAHESTLV